jgi:hypothetical protein
VIIADALFASGVAYEYEARLEAPDGSFRRPDFFIDDAASGRRIYWEHLGMLQDPIYAERWEKKKVWYAGLGIAEANTQNPDGGSEGLLVVTRDDEHGGISSKLIDERVQAMFG